MMYMTRNKIVRFGFSVNESKGMRIEIFHLNLFGMANARTQVTAEQIIHSRKPDLGFSQASTGAMCNARASAWSIHFSDRDCIRGR